ncbi:MAG: hypothetical protein ACLQLH_15240 [Terracidiphilus sp.]
MEKENSSMRDRLLARLPQPENFAAYREETAALLAKHEKALFWEKALAVLLINIGVVVFVLAFSKSYVKLLPGDGHTNLLFGSLYCMIVGEAATIGYRIYRSKVDLLKEIKQLQLQVVELQASFKKNGGS